MAFGLLDDFLFLLSGRSLSSLEAVKGLREIIVETFPLKTETENLTTSSRKTIKRYELDQPILRKYFSYFFILLTIFQKFIFQNVKC